MNETQIDELSNFTKKKRMNKGSSKVVELLDQPDVASGNPPVDEPVDENKNDKPPITGRQCQGHSHPKLLELKTQGRRVHNSSTLSCSQWFPGQRLFLSGYLSTNSYRTHFNCLLIKGLRVVGGDESSFSCKDERASTFSLIQVFGKSGGE